MATGKAVNIQLPSAVTKLRTSLANVDVANLNKKDGGQNPEIHVHG